MQLCCTKKLLDEVGAVPQSGSEENDLFCWSAHLITVNRKKAIVVVNDKSRYAFILYGLKAKDMKSLDKLVLEGISYSLKDEKIKDEIINQYLQAAGSLVLTRTRGPKYVARLNKACELVNFFPDRMDPKTIIQIDASRSLNTDIIKIDREHDYEHPYEILYGAFKEFAGEDIISCEAVELMVRLELGSYTAWRRIITPSDITFRQFHKILQIAYDWKNNHLHEFKIVDQNGSCILKAVSDLEDLYGSRGDCKTTLDTEARLSEYISKDYRIIYTYDLGDNWEHEIVCMDTIKGYDKNYPLCLEGEGNAPPEDVGGIPGYEEFLDIMKDPENEEYEDALNWARSQWYKDFDIDMTNRFLKHGLR